MLSALIITLRETLEAALVVGIILAYLSKIYNLKTMSGRKDARKFVWQGVLGAVIFSIVVAFVFEKYLGGFEGVAEELYEGITMVVAAGLLTWMILWMMKQRGGIRKNIESKVDFHLSKNYGFGLFLLAFVGVAREGVETVIFLQGARIQAEAQGGQVLIGAIFGILLAVFVSYLLFKGIARISLRKFFMVTTLLLILFAAGLMAHGVHELQEAGVLATYNEHLWDMSLILNEESTFGEFLKHVFGYNANPSFEEVAVYFVYLVGMWSVSRRIGKNSG